MNVQHERIHLTARLNLRATGRSDSQVVAPTGRAFVDPSGYLWYEFTTMDLDEMDFWATRHNTKPGDERLTIAHNQTEMEEAFQ